MGSSFDVDDKDINFLKRQWDKLSSFYTPDETIRDEIFQVIKEKYSEKSRFYHNLSHVKSLLKLYESLHASVQNHHAVQFSIWFHDIIYDSKRSDNEEASAGLASELLSQLHVESKTMGFVIDLIVATKNHDGRNLSSDAKFFLDMDLAILGAGEELYQEYSRAIRKEFAWVSESMYREGRKKVLMSFMERKRIYYTDHMVLRYEEQARRNIHMEIQSLDG